MRHTVYKAFWSWNYEKEEKWLAEMSVRGMQLISVGLCKYVFDEGLPNEYNVRLELLDDWPDTPQSVQYIRFIEETGAQYLGSALRWAYFRKKNTEGGFTLFSDIGSRIKYLKRILFFIGFPCILSWLNAIIVLYTYSITKASLALFAFLLHISLGLFSSYGFFKTYSRYRWLKKEWELHE